MRLSVIVPAYNEERNVGPCLAALAQQDIDEPFEVIVVDNASTDRTVEVAESFKDRLNLRVIPEPCKGRGAARATGFRAARGEILLSTDADGVVRPRWVREVRDALGKDDSVAVSGPCFIMDGKPLTRFIVNVILPTSMRFHRMIFGHYWLSGFNFGIKRAAYEAAGGFNPKYDAYEDVELSKRVHKVGYIGFFPHITVSVSGRRFNNGIVTGFGEYLKTFVQAFYRKQTPLLTDIR